MTLPFAARLNGSMLQVCFVAGEFFGVNGWVDACDLAAMQSDLSSYALTSSMASAIVAAAAAHDAASDPHPIYLTQSEAGALYAALSHVHAIADTTGLQAALDAKAANVVGAPTPRTLSLATAYQATAPTKPALVTINLTSTANFSLSGGTTNSADIVIGATNDVASGTGTVLNKYSNSVTGTIAVGLNMNSVMASTYSIPLPVGYYFAVRQMAGTVAITSAFDQALG